MSLVYTDENNISQRRNNMKKIISFILCICMLAGIAVLTGCGKTDEPESTTGSSGTTAQVTPPEDTTAPSTGDDEVALKEKRERLKSIFLSEADQVIVTDDAVTFTDASSVDGSTITVPKNPGKTVNLYASFTTLWYEAGGTVAGCIGGDSSVALYEEYIGRDITQDEGIVTVATSSSGKKWDVETIIALKPDLIICSTAMSGYSTIQSPAEAANIPVIAMSYNDFSDYLKWFKVFCNITGNPELWDSVAMKALDDVVDVLLECPTENNPTVFSMFYNGAENLQANTSGTVVGGMLTEMNAINIVYTWDNTTSAERLEINLETVFLANPDIIVVQCHASEAEAKESVESIYGSNPVWQSLKAVKEGKVYYLEKSLFHNKPNSRFAEAYQKLAAILYPDTTFSFQEEN